MQSGQITNVLSQISHETLCVILCWCVMIYQITLGLGLQPESQELLPHFLCHSTGCYFPQQCMKTMPLPTAWNISFTFWKGDWTGRCYLFFCSDNVAIYSQSCKFVLYADRCFLSSETLGLFYMKNIFY